MSNQRLSDMCYCLPYGGCDWNMRLDVVCWLWQSFCTSDIKFVNVTMHLHVEAGCCCSAMSFFSMLGPAGAAGIGAYPMSFKGIMPFMVVDSRCAYDRKIWTVPAAGRELRCSARTCAWSGTVARHSCTFPSGHAQLNH